MLDHKRMIRPNDVLILKRSLLTKDDSCIFVLTVDTSNKTVIAFGNFSGIKTWYSVNDGLYLHAWENLGWKLA